MLAYVAKIFYKKKQITFEPGYNDISFCDIFQIASDILRYQ